MIRTFILTPKHPRKPSVVLSLLLTYGVKLGTPPTYMVPCMSSTAPGTGTLDVASQDSKPMMHGTRVMDTVVLVSSTVISAVYRRSRFAGTGRRAVTG